MNTRLLLLLLPLALGAAEKPNILWITSEDNGPHLGCYGDEYADTPNLDRLAARGFLYRNAWSTAPVCAPARTTLISGMYPTSLGAQHMRSTTDLPDGHLMYPQYLAAAGYHCHNHRKEDYNLNKPGQVWEKGEYKTRKQGKPFFQIYNSTISHESKLRTRPHTQVHDPAKVRVPAYHPDTPEVRQDWAQYYDRITEMDRDLGKRLDQLEKDGLADNTIIFYYGDHGSGMPRGKRWPYNSGLNVPLIVHVPEQFKHLAPEGYKAGGETDALVGFVDFAPTVLSLAGIEPPAHMQGHAFMGPHRKPAQPYIYGFRGRMDERMDCVRVVRDKQYIYLRHFNPHRIYGQHVRYMFQTPTTQVWRRLFDEGKLNDAQSAFWQRKPAEELYDLQADPDEVNNLAADPAHAAKLEELRDALAKWQTDTRDLLMSEHDLHHRHPDLTPREAGAKLPLAMIHAMARAASNDREADLRAIRAGLGHPDPTVRYWATLGFAIRGGEVVREHAEELRDALNDDWPIVRVAAAEALAHHGEEADAKAAIDLLVQSADAPTAGNFVAIHAMNVIDDLGERMAPWKEQLRGLGKPDAKAPKRTQGYVGRLQEKIAAEHGL